MKIAWSARAILFAFAFAFIHTPSLAQDDPHAHHEPAGYVPREILERPLSIRAGVGAVHEAVTTSSREAQAYYDQGLAYLHSYVWIEAARSFNQALKLDPKLAMAHLGLSRAHSGLEDPKAARASVEKAQSLASSANAWEQRRIMLRAKQIEALEDLANPQKHVAYKKALDDALASYISDAELWLLRGNAEEPTAAGRGQRGGAASTAFYEKVFVISPDNFAAHHYLIHSYENIGLMEPALKHGEAYSRLAYSIPHAHHMYGHDLRRVGRIADAIAAFRKADELEHAYYKAEDIPADMDWHHPHNLDLLSTSYQYVGQMKTAEALMREAVAMAAVSDGREFNKKEWPSFLLSRGRVGESLKAANDLAKGKWPGGRAIGHLLAGHALLAMKRMQTAKEELAVAEKEAQSMPAIGAYVTQASIQPYLDGLRAEILLREGKLEEGRVILKEVMRRLRATPGPDAWSQALFRLESIARTARDVGDWELAEYAARQMLDHDSAYAGTHYALGLVSEHKGDLSTAQKEFAVAEKYWREADADLPELAEIKAKLKSGRK